MTNSIPTITGFLLSCRTRKEMLHRDKAFPESAYPSFRRTGKERNPEMVNFSLNHCS
ncbi:hypothetical protein [Stakelama pacifica]|uniref:hypothetical protein n=1 Tax=Stakelama pacifica TaxID=517720 RepID=UPI0013C2CB02|nr:hypothetical protein [Stakelama pacifica]